MKNDRFKKGVEDEFTQLYNEHREAIYKFCLAKLHADVHAAEDCMQNAFIVLYKKMLNKEEITYPKAFLYKTANNFILKKLSHSANENRRLVPLDSQQELLTDSTRQLDSEIDYELLKEKIYSVLSSSEKQLFDLKYINGFTNEAAAETLGISAPAAAKRLQRMREKLINSVLTEWKGDGYEN